MLSHSTPPKHLERWLTLGALTVYAAMTWVTYVPDLIWDEGRYLWYARNLTQGFYVNPDYVDLINGPGYPLVLAPFVALGTPLWVPRLLNAGFMALAAWFSYRAVRPIADWRWALAAALTTTFHPMLLRTGPFLMTEALSICCVAAVGWGFTALLRTESRSWPLLITTAFAFAWLILTRVLFGHLLLATAAFLLIALVLWKGQRARMGRSLVMFAVAFAFCLPYLAYTQVKTGQTLCWSTTTGEFLYWITSTREGENGHWFSPEDACQRPELAPHHRDLFSRYYDVSVPERETMLSAAAAEQLRTNPLGVVHNILSNSCRLWFGFPRSFHPEELSTVLLVLTNGLILFLSVATAGVMLLRWREQPAEVWILALMTLIYFGGSSLAPGLPRHLVVIWPWAAVVIASVLSRHVRLRLA